MLNRSRRHHEFTQAGPQAYAILAAALAIYAPRAIALAVDRFPKTRRPGAKTDDERNAAKD